MSDKSVAQKLQMKPNRTVFFVNAPQGCEAKLGRLPEGVFVIKKAQGRIDFIQVFVNSRKELEREVPRLKNMLAPDGMLWVTYHRGTSRITTDINRDKIAAYARLVGMQAVAQIAMSPPASAHVLGLVLKRLTRRPWVMDLRDPWTLEPLNWYLRSGGSRLALEKGIERVCFRNADAIITTTPEPRDKYAEVYPGCAARIHSIPNGYDAQEFKAARSSVLESDILKGVGELIMMPGPVSHMDALRIMHRSDLLLLYDPNREGAYYVRGKLHEYLASGRPILGVLPEGATRRLLERSGHAIAVTRDDEQAIRSALRAPLSEPGRRARVEFAGSQYEGCISRRRLWTSLAELVDDCWSRYHNRQLEYRRAASPLPRIGLGGST